MDIFINAAIGLAKIVLETIPGNSQVQEYIEMAGIILKKTNKQWPFIKAHRNLISMYDAHKTDIQDTKFAWLKGAGIILEVKGKGTVWYIPLSTTYDALGDQTDEFEYYLVKMISVALPSTRREELTKTLSVYDIEDEDVVPAEEKGFIEIAKTIKREVDAIHRTGNIMNDAKAMWSHLKESNLFEQIEQIAAPLTEGLDENTVPEEYATTVFRTLQKYNEHIK